MYSQLTPGSRGEPGHSGTSGGRKRRERQRLVLASPSNSQLIIQLLILQVTHYLRDRFRSHTSASSSHYKGRIKENHTLTLLATADLSVKEASRNGEVLLGSTEN